LIDFQQTDPFEFWK